MLKYLILLILVSLLTANIATAQSSNVTIVDKPKVDKTPDKKSPPKDDKPKVKIVEKKSKPIIKFKERVKVVHDPFKLSVDNLLLLNSQQLCILASVTCSQNSFMTTSITTSLHSSTWSISGTVKNVGQESLRNVVATAILYDINSKQVGDSAAATVSPSTIKSFDEGTFNLDIKGKDAVFIVLSYK